MSTPPTGGIGVKFLLTSAAIIVILAGLKAAQSLISPFLLAVFFAMILTPPLRWLKKKGLPEFLAILVLSLSVFLMGLGIVLIFTNSLTRFGDRLPAYAEKVTTAYTAIDTLINDVADKFYDMGQTIYQLNPLDLDEPVEEEPAEEETADETFTEPVSATFTEPVSVDTETVPEPTTVPPEREKLSLSGIISVNTLISYVQLGVNTLLNIATVSTLILIMLVFMLVEAARIPDKIKEAFGGHDLSSEYLKKIADDTWNYMKIKTIICFMTWFSAFIGLWFLGVEYAILWGMLLFFLNYIPNIGQVFAAIPPVLLALVDGGVSLAIWVTVWMVIVNSFWGLAIEPRYMGQGLGISSLVVLLSLIFWGWLLGPVGMFLSAPLTMVVKIVLQNGERTKWIAVLLSNR